MNSENYRPALFSIAFIFAVLAVGTACRAQIRDRARESGRQVKLPASGGEYTVLPVEGARPVFSPDGNWIYYDWKDSSGKFMIYRIHPDGTGRECLTCGRSDLYGHAGAVSFHPSGRYIVFTVEKKNAAGLKLRKVPSGPGGGIFNDVAVMDLTDRHLYILTNVSNTLRNSGGSIYPKFSPDGSKIAWGDYENKGTSDIARFGNWRLAVADFSFSPQPALSNIRHMDPAPDSIYEVQGWTSDGRGIYAACKPYNGQDGNALDFCQIDASSGRLMSLTKTSGVHGEPAEFEEHGKLAPRGDVIAFIGSSPHGIQTSNFLTWLKTELWLMSPDGSRKRKRTHFNDAGFEESDPEGERVMVSELAFSPDGEKLIARVHYVNKPKDMTDDYSSLMIFSLSGR